jgi:hypothetical protein
LAGFEVQEIAFAPDRLEQLLGFEIETPPPGAKRNAHVLHATGWVLGRDRPATAIEVSEGGRMLRTVPVRGPREDVIAAFGAPPDTNCVFHVMISLLGLGLDPALELRVVLEGGTTLPAAHIRLRREPLRSDYEPRLAPLMVTTTGRSGSTYLMQLLASHPQVVVFRRFPYESATGKYWMHMLRVLSEPVNLVESAGPTTFQDDMWWVGNNPFHDDRVYEQPSLEDWFARHYVERLATFSLRSTDDWYLTLARTQAQPAPVYFAEKHMGSNLLPALTKELYPHAKEVFLVRDFRDMARSIIAFDDQRGYAGFGRTGAETDEQYLRDGLRRISQDLLESWRSRRDAAHLVRYEDLILQPEETLTALLAYLEVDDAPGTVQQVLRIGSEEVLRLAGASYEPSELRAHRTIADPKASIGRWRREGDDALRELSAEVFGEALEEFGYS